MKVLPDDKALLTTLDDFTPIGTLASQLTRGSLVALGTEEQVWEARRRFADLDNVMFTAGGRDEIPWRTQTFSLILDLNPDEPTAEMTRVLAPGGRINEP